MLGSVGEKRGPGSASLTCFAGAQGGALGGVPVSSDCRRWAQVTRFLVIASSEWDQTQSLQQRESRLIKRQYIAQSMGAADSQQRWTLGGWRDAVLTRWIFPGWLWGGLLHVYK